MSILNLTSPTIAAFKHFQGAETHTLQELDYSSVTSPTSGSSSAAFPATTFNELTITSPQTVGRRPRMVSTRDNTTPRILQAKKPRNSSTNDLKFENMSRGAAEAFNSLQNCLDNSPLSLKFTQEFYQRIEDYLDQENLHVIVPSYEHIEAKAKEAVRRLIVARSFSENVDVGDTQCENGDFPSPGLRNNILCSTLARRRASLSHTSSLEIAAVHESTMIKKSAFYACKETIGINEEKESPSASKRDRDSFGFFSEVASSLSRKKSSRLSSCLALSPTKNQAQSPSPSGFPVELERKISMASPQKDRSSFSFQIVPLSPMTCLAKKTTHFGGRVGRATIGRSAADTTSFGEINMKSQDSTPMGVR